MVYPNIFKSKGFLASSLSTYNFLTLCTTLRYNLMKEKLTELIEQTINIETTLYLACIEERTYVTSEQPKCYKIWLFHKM